MTIGQCGDSGVTLHALEGGEKTQGRRELEIPAQTCPYDSHGMYLLVPV